MPTNFASSQNNTNNLSSLDWDRIKNYFVCKSMLKCEVVDAGYCRRLSTDNEKDIWKEISILQSARHTPAFRLQSMKNNQIWLLHDSQKPITRYFCLLLALLEALY